jgi:serine/threonine protein kinase
MAVTPTLLRAGDVIGGFRVEDLIGIGGMATVYRAEQISLGRPVALKVLARQLGDDGVFRERFRREGKHAASLEHPNIVPVYDSGEEDGLLYLAMRLVDGRSLAELLGEKGVTADQAIEILGPIGAALDCAHVNGLIHRDVKPSNILITDQGHPYLTDFGVAKSSAVSGLTATGGFVGSVNYASPEQIRGQDLSTASDVYALTAVLYHSLSGEVPYPAESEAGVMHSHLYEPPPTLPTLDGAESGFHTVLARGMAKDPGSRYGHAGDLMNAAALCVGSLSPQRRKAIPAFPRGGRAEIDRVPGSGAASPGSRGTEVFTPPPVESLTAADSRRAPVPEETSASPRRRLPRVALSRRTGIALAGVGAAALVALGVVLLAGGGDDGGSAGPTAKAAARGPVEVSYAAPLAPVAGKGSATFAGVGFRAPLMLRGGGETLVAGMLRAGAPVPGGIPPSFAAAVAKPKRAPQRLASAASVRYVGRARHGAAALTMFVVPTARGDLGVLCEGARGAGASACLKAARTLRVRGLRTVPPGADPALAKQLSVVLGPVRTTRHASASLLVAAPAHRAVGAGRIAAADATAAKALADATTEPRDRRAVAALATGLGDEGSALRRLGAAARARDYGTYAAAAEAVQAAGLRSRRATKALRRMGFGHVPVLGAVTVAALHRPPAPTPPVVEETPATPVVAEESTPTPEYVAPAPAPEAAPSPSPAPSQTIVSAPK